MSSDSEHCSTCVRAGRSCELAPPYQEMERLDKVEDKLAQEMMEAEAKLLRLRKQRRLLQKKRRALGARELQNVEELEIDEMMTEGVEIFEGDGQLPAPGALNSPSPRPSSFTVPVGGEGSTDPFLGLLDSPGRSAEVPQGSS